MYKNWQRLSESGISKHKLIQFHSEHKYMLMSHDLLAYKELGRLLGDSQLPIEELAEQYIAGLMCALKIKATRKKHANTLQHIQGYFTKQLSANERQELCQQINDYRMGLVPLVVPLTLIKHYLMHYPKKYIAQQAYLNPYPDQLRLRYGY